MCLFFLVELDLSSSVSDSINTRADDYILVCSWPACMLRASGHGQRKIWVVMIYMMYTGELLSEGLYLAISFSSLASH